MRWVVLLLLIPFAAGQAGIENPDDSTPTTLWLHCLGTYTDCPMTTQAPMADSKAAYPIFGATQQCAEIPGLRLASGDLHTQYAFPQPLGVEIDPDGDLRSFGSMGLASKVLLDQSAPAFLEWHVFVEASHEQPVATAISPQTVVEATVRTGGEVSVNHEAMNAGKIIMHGLTEPVDLHPAMDHPQVTYAPLGNLDVYTFHIPLDVSADVIPKAEAFNLRVDVYQAIPGCSDREDHATLPTVKSFHALDRAARLDFSIFNPLTVQYFVPQFIGDDLVIHAEVRSPWGLYDVGEGLSITIEGPSEARTLDQVQYSRAHVHGDEDRAFIASWVWPYVHDQALDGNYTARLEATNGQESATATASALFAIGTHEVSYCAIEGNGTVCTQATTPPTETTPAPIVAALLGLLIALRKRTMYP